MVKILIVDDEQGYRDPLQSLLSREGHEVRAVASGREALEIAADFAPEVVIVDWMLRDYRDGLELVETLRQRTPQVKTILITGYPTATLETQATGISACQFLAKPFTLSQLTAAIRAAVGETNPG
jgi:DNA-binding response OmpR family regulator